MYLINYNKIKHLFVSVFLAVYLFHISLTKNYFTRGNGRFDKIFIKNNLMTPFSHRAVEYFLLLNIFKFNLIFSHYILYPQMFMLIFIKHYTSTCLSINYIILILRIICETYVQFTWLLSLLILIWDSFIENLCRNFIMTFVL